jgi:hypothetical protein
MPNNNSDVQRAKDVTVPTLNILRTTIDRRVSHVRESMRNDLTKTLRSIVDTGEIQIKSTHKKLREQVWSPAGAELLKNEAIAEGVGMIKLLADAATKNARDHRGQLDRELSQVPEPPNAFLAHEVRQELKALDKSDRDFFLTRTSDPQLVSAVLHGPTAFPLGSDDARARMLSNYNKTHRPDKVALRDDAHAFVFAVEDFVEDAARHLRDVLS